MLIRRRRETGRYRKFARHGPLSSPTRDVPAAFASLEVFGTVKRSLAGFLLSLVLGLNPCNTFAARVSNHLHVMLAIDTDAEGIGTSRDLEIWSEVIGEIRQGREGRVSLTVVQGRTLTPDTILNFYRDLGQRPGWALLFVYSGHGATGTDGDHYLTMTHGNLARSRLRNALEGTGANLQVILTDCCGSIMPFEAEQRPVPAEWAMFEQLFFEAGGMVDILSCDLGAVSFGSDSTGGMFTRACTRLLCSPVSRSDGNSDGRVNWTEFFNRLRADTQRIATSAGGTQKPAFWYLGGRQRYDQVVADTVAYARLAQSQLSMLVARASAAAGSGSRGYRQVTASSLEVARINVELATRNVRAARLNVAAHNAGIISPSDSAATRALLDESSQLASRYREECRKILAWLRREGPAHGELILATPKPRRASNREDSVGTPVSFRDGRLRPSPGFPTGSEVCLASTPAGFDSLELHAFSSSGSDSSR